MSTFAFTALTPRRHSAAKVFFILVVVGCGRDVVGTGKSRIASVDTLAITSDVAKGLSSDGQFILPGPAPGSTGELSEPDAREIARIWIRDYFPWVHSEIEKQHGSRIDPSRLRVCSRAYYAESPYEPADDSYDGGVARRAFGPWWVIPLCVDGRPQALLGLASFATDLRIENGSIRFPKFSGNEFVWRGIPNTVSEIPISPEAAVQFAAGATRSRVAAIPRLVVPDFRNGGPFAARWQLALEPHAALTGVESHRLLDAGVIYMGPTMAADNENIMQVAAPEQPDAVQIDVVDWANPKVGKSILLKRKPAGVLRFEQVEIR